MIVLGLDTATPASVVGLRLADGRTLQARDDPGPGQRPGHATRLLPLAHELLEEAGIDWPQLERIAVGVGPGTFTGLRIGIATARGLAQSLGVKLVGVSSLRALAHGAGERAPRVLTAIDARRGEVFVAAYEGEQELVAPHAAHPEELGELLDDAAIELRSEEWLALGDGALLYREAFERLGVHVDGSPGRHLIQARSVCALGERASTSSEPILPDYRRRPDAEIALEGART
ncbi:MAG TPA: tRNA (adenosine(37)-N6)-threonylcarbamoyltransferase complex dimerization subunit type 1 TsaB [Solirubrobacteraceae bacterium]|jgi:tRNA threonylcarbamoyladenosine biosynthesis protein TsaB|nr:tRNA (adenosine(37)-N6)-threonylcarbamoyltransferase complex dimerization subunit type 1 TsaB [Solirubrobacteraceae bacterium]